MNTTISPEHWIAAPPDVVCHCIADDREHSRPDASLPSAPSDFESRGGIAAGASSRPRGRAMTHAVEIILARQLASGLAVPVLLVDARGDTLFYNEPAEAIFGRHFDEIDALPFEERMAALAPRRVDDQPLPVGRLPGMLAMRERRPAHARFCIHGLDAVLRAVEATAVPIESADGRVLGALIAMWQGRMANP